MLLLGALQAQDDVHIVTQGADHEFHVVIAPLDRETRFAAADRLTLSALAIGTSTKIYRDWLGDAMDGEIAADFVVVAAAFDLAALEGYRRELFRVEKIGALEVLVAFLVARVHAFHRQGQFDRAFRGIGGIESYRAGDLFERSVKVGDAIMFDPENDGGMNGIDFVGIGTIRREGDSERAEEAGEDEFDWFHRFVE